MKSLSQRVAGVGARRWTCGKGPRRTAACRAWAALVSLALAAGCSQSVPQGHVGKVLTAAGWQEAVSESGYVSCWGRDQLYLLETGDCLHTEQLNILCADKLNFRCDLMIVSRAKGDTASRNAIFARLQARSGEGGRPTIGNQQLYDVYVKPVVVPAAYDVVSRRETDQVGEDMPAIKREIVELCYERMGDDMPVEVLLIDFTNTEYPETGRAGQRGAQAEGDRAQRRGDRRGEGREPAAGGPQGVPGAIARGQNDRQLEPHHWREPGGESVAHLLAPDQ